MILYEIIIWYGNYHTVGIVSSKGDERAQNRENSRGKKA